MRPQLRNALVLVGVFALGGVAGGAVVRGSGQREYARHLKHGRGPSHKMRVRAMTRHLDLSKEQQQQIEAIHAKHHPEVRAAHQKCEPEMRAAKKKIDAEVEAVLEPEQKQKYQAWREKRRQAREQRRAGRAGDAKVPENAQ